MKYEEWIVEVQRLAVVKFGQHLFELLDTQGQFVTLFHEGFGPREAVDYLSPRD